MMYDNRVLLVRLLGYVRNYLGIFLLGVVATVAMAVTQPAIAAMLKPLLDGAFIDKDPLYIRWVPIGLVALFFLRGVTSFVSVMAFAWLSSKVVLDFRIVMFEKTLRLPARFYDEHVVGKLISKFTNDVTQVTASATDALLIIVRDSVQVVGLILWLMYLDWRLSLSILAIIPVIYGVVVVAGRRLRAVSLKLQWAFGDLTHILGESLRGHKEVKIYGGQDYERKRFFFHANWVRRYQVKFRSTGALSVPVVEFLSAILMAIIIAMSTRAIQHDEMTAGDFMSFFAALALLLSPIKRLTKVNEPLQRSLAAAQSVFGLIDEAAERDAAPRRRVRLAGNIELSDVVFSYPQAGKPAINGLSLSVAANETVALVGASGSGKTTLAALIPRLYDIDAGHIRIDGRDLCDIALADLRDNIALVSQEVTLFNDTVTANVTYGSAGPVDAQRLHSVLAAAHAGDFVAEMPQGVDTLMGDNGVRLSGGQRQRIAIARALYKDAPILILDEATSALDSESERQVQAALDNLMRDRTTLIIAHRLSTIEKADRVVVLRRGAIVEMGSPTELLAAGGHYAKLYRTQFKQQGALDG